MQSLKKKIRQNESLKAIYKSIVTPIIILIRKIIIINEKKITFISFGGEKFDDSPRVIYEHMIKDRRFDDFEIVWALDRSAVNQDSIREIGARCTIVNPNSINYFRELFSSKTWITNVSVKRGLNFSSDKHIYINTWHGTPIKYIANDVKKIKSKYIENVIYLSQTNYEMNIFPRAFNVPKKNVLPVGLPRNEILVDSRSKINLDKVKEEIGITIDKEVILYAPTWRETKANYPFIDVDILSKSLNSNQILLYRGHHAMDDIISFNEDASFIDVSSYEHLNDLLLISDVLITDYSSIMVDYSLLNRPIILYIKDYEEYKKTRGLYFNILDEFRPIIFQEQRELEKYLRDYKYHKYGDNKVKEKFKCINKQPSIEILNLIQEKYDNY